MPNAETEEESIQEIEVKELLNQIKDLLVLQLRHAEVDDSAIGNIIGVKAKTVRNRYPLTKKETEETSSKAQEPAPAGPQP